MVIRRLIATERDRMLFAVDHDSTRHNIFTWQLNSLWPARSQHVLGIVSLSPISPMRLDKEASNM